MTATTPITFEMLADYCATQGRKCYGGYSPEVLRDYLAFHLQHDTVRWVRNPEHGTRNSEQATRHTDIIGIGIAWRTSRELVLQRVRQARTVFDWQPDDPAGDSIFVADFVCTAPGALRSLVSAFSKRFANVDELNWFTCRHGRLVELKPAALRRVLERNG